jgi:hypothetical protein
MQFLTSKEAVDFLSQAAPRPWVCRMLRWMIVDEQLWGYFSKAQIQASAPGYQFLLPLAEEAGTSTGPEFDALIDRDHEPGLAEKLKGKSAHETILDDPLDWEAEEGPEAQDPGYFLFASDIDWDTGVLKSDWLPTDPDVIEMFFPTSEFFYSEFEHPSYSVRFEGLAFDRARIEMMLPNFKMGEVGLIDRTPVGGRRHVGRPSTWDWEGALAYVVTQAQTPDGLPTGHGAQARIETMIAEWFESEVGGSPAVSQIRKRASSVVRALEKD